MTDGNEAYSLTPYWEVQGQNAAGEWFGLYQAVSEEEGRAMLAIVVREFDAPQHERWEDFRLAEPSVKRTEKVRQEEAMERITVGLVRRPARRKRKTA